MTVAIIVPRSSVRDAIKRARALPVWNGHRTVPGRHADPVVIRPTGRGTVRAEWPFEPEPTDG